MSGRVAAVLAAVASLAVLATGCGSVGRVDEASTSGGKELFQQNCGSCHALADAGTQGTIGPNLDEAFAYARKDQEDQGFDESTIRDVVRGQIAYPVEDPPTGEPGMPADIVTGDDADTVAAYVASVAGLPVVGGPGGQIEATGGEEIFTAAGCGSCHTFAAAGATGTIGPSLDSSQPSVELAIDRVTNGAGAMPAFGDRLDEAQIRAVAEYVAGGGAQ